MPSDTGASFISLLPLIFWIGLFVGLAFIPANIAKKKGYSYGGFWVFGFFLFLIALIVALCLEDRNAQRYGQPYPLYQQPYQQPYQAPNAQAQTVVCPSCGASIAGDSAFCPKCGFKVK